MKLLHRNRRSKRGSSLPMVMAIGAALVVWVMALMPLMATSGTTAAQTKALEANYLSSKSSIEFVKGELQNMVKSGAPKTFAVVINGGEYASIPKYDAVNNPDSAYTSLVNTSANPANKEDSLDVPKSADVVAICAVEHAVGSRFYDITIKTYNNGEEGMTYTATYTGAGNLKIFPEMYKRTEALPLSDFVLVDGQLGHQTVWKSHIESTSDRDFREFLNPDPQDPSNTDHDAKEYPVVFKKTAEAHMEGQEGYIPKGDEALVDPTPENWILPTASDFIFDEGDCSIDINPNGRLKDLTMGSVKHTVYYNGVPSMEVPTATGIYRVTLSVESSGDYDEAKTNVLAVDGLVLGEYSVQAKKASYGTSDVTINKTEDTAIFYKDSSVDGPIEFFIKEGNGNRESVEAGKTIELDPSKSYSFYVRANGYVTEDGVIYEPSTIDCCGTYVKSGKVTELSSGEQYVILRELTPTEEDPEATTKSYLAFYRDGSSLKAKKVELPDLSDLTMSHITDKGISFWTYAKEDIKYGYYKNQTLKGCHVLKSLNGDGKYSYLSIRSNGYNGGSLELTSHNSNNVISQNVSLSITNDGTDFQVYRNSYYLTLKAQTYGENSYYSAEAEKNAITSNLLFVKVNSAPDSSIVSVPSINLSQTDTYGKITPQSVARGNSDISALYLNGTKYDLTDTTVLPAGKYMVHVSLNGFSFVPAGTVTVNPDAFALDTSNAVNIVNDDGEIEFYQARFGDFNWSNKVPARYYYGFLDENDTIHWTNTQTILNMSVGTYTFVVWQSGDNNHVSGNDPYNPETLPKSSEIEVVHPYWTKKPGEEAQFKYTIDPDTHAVIWYQLPIITVAVPGSDEEVKVPLVPSRVTLLYGDKTWAFVTYYTTWRTSFQSNPDLYGVLVERSGYTTDKQLTSNYTALTLTNSPSQLGTDETGTFRNSVIMGNSIYFMGNSYTSEDVTYSVHTHGTSVTVSADLLVMRHGIQTKGPNGEATGSFNVTAYSQNKTLLLVMNDFGPFEAKHFYLLSNSNGNPIDLAAVTSIDGNRVQNAGYIDSGAIVGQARELLYGGYPQFIADIAYANAEQLYRIVSSETIGWTVDGILKSGSGNYSSLSGSSYNVNYAVCTFVESVASSVDYAANRILIAVPKAGDGKYRLDVSSNTISFHSRYTTIDADIVSGNSFKVHVLSDSDNILESVMEWLFNVNLVSNTVQVDLKKDTIFASYSPIPANVYRYNTGSDLLKNAARNSDLAVDYPAGKLSATMSKTYLRTEIQERYVQFSNSDGFDTINVSRKRSIFNSSQRSTNFYIYTNFLRIDGVTTINLQTNRGTSTVHLNTQENGYSSDEYLGLFKSASSESYHGTMIYCKNPLTITDGNNSVTIPVGMYFIDSSELKDDDNLYSLAGKIATNRSAYEVDQEWLAENAAYITLGGDIQNSYVDSDVLGGGSGSVLVGFSGGGLQ